MSSKISIMRKDGTKVNLNGDGNIWHVTDKTGGPCIGYMAGRVCNITHLYGLDEKTKDKYYPVNRLVLKYAEKFKIKKIRVEIIKNIRTDVGNRCIVRYGYASRDKFPYFLKHRKQVSLGMSNSKAVLLRKSDLTVERR